MQRVIKENEVKFGLSDSDLERIVNVFLSDYRIETILIFGSRALGIQKEGSDIDMAIKSSDLEKSELFEIRQKLEGLHLPWFFDVIHFESITNPELKEHIERVGKVIWTKNVSH
jgi:predicted nucleotidyltransferase